MYGKETAIPIRGLFFKKQKLWFVSDLFLQMQ